ncbi:hypothetical protein [Mangrovibacterium sp.]
MGDDLPDLPVEEEINESEFYADLYRAIAKLPEHSKQIFSWQLFSR